MRSIHNFKKEKKMSKKTITLIATLIFMLSSIILATLAFAQTKPKELDVTLKLIADKDSYLKGELVNLKLELTNNGAKTIEFIQPHENRISVAKEGETYKLHDGSPKDCGSYDFEPLTPNQSWSMTMLPFLWNGKPTYSNLAGNTKSIEDFDKQTRVVTEYVFQDATTYNASVSVKFKDSEKLNGAVIRSEPAKINIKEPEGEDFEVWKQIEGNNGIAFLMQKREDFKIADDKKHAALIREVEQIIINHPNSTYAKYLKQGIDKYKTNADKQKQP
jgi:hypothetical protein